MQDDATGGSDTFVLAGAFGNDFIHDFRQEDDDLIEFQVDGVDFDTLDTNGNDYLDDGDDFASIIGLNTEIDIGAASGGASGENTATLVDPELTVTGMLTENDVWFT